MTHLFLTFLIIVNIKRKSIKNKNVFLRLLFVFYKQTLRQMEQKDIALIVIERRITKLLERVMSKINKCIAEDIPDAQEIDLNIPKFVKTTVKDLAEEIEREIEQYSITSIDQQISDLSISEKDEENEENEKEENEENDKSVKEEKKSGSSKISTSPLPAERRSISEISDPIEFAMQMANQKKKSEKKEDKKSDVNVICTVYKKKGQEGDFEWHITSGQYEDSLFLFSEDEKRCKWKRAGSGSAVIRKYNKYALPERPRSCGIIVGNEEGYSTLSDNAKKSIDASIEDARQIIKKYGYKKVYYSASSNGMIGTSTFKLGDEVISYVTKKIFSLGNVEMEM